MKGLKRYFFQGFLFVSILGTLFHFVYEATGQCVFVGLFTPVNESTWEHMKLLFFPFCLFSLLRKPKVAAPCLSSAMALGALCGTFLIPVLFYTYTGILGFHTALVDISLFYISTIAAFWISYKATLSCSAKPYARLLKGLCIALVLCFVIFTFYPPNLPLFISP